MIKTPVDLLLDQLEYASVEPREHPDMESKMPYVTHEGVLEIMEAKLRVYMLSDGQRVIDASDVESFFGLTTPTKNK